MAEKTKANLTLDFETGDTPDGSNFADLIDSQVNLAETTVQSMAAGLTGPSFGGTTVSAVNMKAGNIAVTGGVSASAGEFGTLAVSGASTLGRVSATSINVSGIVSAQVINAVTARVVELSVSGDAHVHGDFTVEGTFAATQTEVGELYISATASVSASATPVEFIANTTSDSRFLVNFEVSANRLVYKGAATRNFLATGTVAIEASQNNTNTILCLAVNASAELRTSIDTNVGTTEVIMVVHGMVQLAPEDSVSMMINSEVAGAVGYDFHRATLTVKD